VVIGDTYEGVFVLLVVGVLLKQQSGKKN